MPVSRIETTTPLPVNGETSALTASIPQAFWAWASASGFALVSSSTNWISLIGMAGAIPTTVGSRDTSRSSLVDRSALSTLGRAILASGGTAISAASPAENGSVVGAAAILRRMVNLLTSSLLLACMRVHSAAHAWPARATTRPAAKPGRRMSCRTQLSGKSVFPTGGGGDLLVSDSASSIIAQAAFVHNGLSQSAGRSTSVFGAFAAAALAACWASALALACASIAASASFASRFRLASR